MRPTKTEAGVSLVLSAALLFVMLAMAALAIDGVHLYVARSEAQRAADAAALAGARSLAEDGYTSGLVSATVAQTIARQRAETVGTMNLVGGQPPSITDGDVTFDFSRPGDPLVTVVAQRSAARGNPLPTFFARLWGYKASDVSATATAEAFNPSGSGMPAAVSCLKPWVLPNCDPNHSNPANPICAGTYGSFVNNGNISNRGLYTGPNSGGVIGEHMILKPGQPSSAPAPSQYYPVQIALSPNPLCPSCASLTSGGGTSGGAVYRENIECCNTNIFVCGSSYTVDLTLASQTGNMQGPTRQGVSCLIHELPNGSGQDILDTTLVPFQIQGGSNNPNPSLQGVKPISTSDSIVSVPIYDGTPLCPGGSCTSTVTVIGFLQMFINSVDPTGNVDATILNVAACPVGGGGGGGGTGGGGSGNGGVVTGGGLSPIPVRLVHR